jgi:site-specific recombinase XerD
MSEKTLSKAADDFIAHLRQLGKKERTLYTYRRDLAVAEEFFGKDRPLSEILVPQVGKFFKSPQLLKLPDGKDRAERTVAKTMRVFRMMMVWAKESGRINEMPLPKNTPMGYSKAKDEGNDA